MPVEERLGGTPDAVDVPFWRSLRRSVADSVRLVGLSVLVGIPLLAAGFIPVLGQTVVPVIGAAVGGLASLGADGIAAGMAAYRSEAQAAHVMGRIARGFSEAESRAIAEWIAAGPRR